MNSHALNSDFFPASSADTSLVTHRRVLSMIEFLARTETGYWDVWDSGEFSYAHKHASVDVTVVGSPYLRFIEKMECATILELLLMRI